MVRQNFKIADCLFLCISIFLIQPCFSQSPIEEDVEFWNSIELEKEIVDDLSLGLEVGSRLEDNVSTLKSFLGEIGVGYKLNKHYKFGIGYRVTISPDKVKNRGSATFSWSDKIVKRTELGYRLKFQRDYEVNELPLNRLRNRIELKHRIKKTDIEPYVALESFYNFYYKGNFFSRTRVYIGSDFKLSKKSDMSIRLMRQWNYNDGAPSNSTIVSVGYKLELK